LQVAVNRGHTRVEENDLLGAQQQYSRFALDSMLVEGGNRIPRLEDLIYEFVGSSEVITEADVLRAMKVIHMPENELEDVIDALTGLTFIGLEVAPNRFAFLYDEDITTKFEVMARKTAAELGSGVRRYRINKAFQAYLEIMPQASLLPGQIAMDLEAS